MMYTRGEFHDTKESYGVITAHSKSDHSIEVLLVLGGQVYSAFKHNNEGDYSYNNSKAKDFYKIIQTGLAGCKAKNGESMPFVYGTSVIHEFTKAKVEYQIELYNGELVNAEISTPDNKSISLKHYMGENLIPNGIPYIQLTSTKQTFSEEDKEESLDDVVVRSVEEIALEKDDITWLKKKKYYIVNDDNYAEQIFNVLENYDGPIAYDTETTGLKINCFGKIGSKYKATLEKYNEEHPDNKLRADRLVGIIFCVEEDVSYYFPCFNRKFKNLYEEDTPERRQLIQKIKERYSKYPLNPMQWDMYNYINNTPPEEWTLDVLLMERVRVILETKHLAAHNGSFEYKVGCLFGIDTNLKDDTMILHQIMYKFRTTTSNRGEPSNLKYLSKVELGIDQWELEDFFPSYKEDSTGLVNVQGQSKRKKKASNKIDFSYMTYEGTRIYAPTDGDATFLLLKKYKADLLKNHKEQEYIYNVEIVVSCCIGYMEFWGHRIDEDKIYGVRDQTRAEIACIESEIRQKVGYANKEELEAYNSLKESMKQFSELDESASKEERNAISDQTIERVGILKGVIANNTDHELNLGSPAQVAELFYDVLGYPMQGDKKSVASKQIKPLLKARNDDGELLYPVVSMYAEYKKKDTLMTKFYDNLPGFMYPGGFIFSSFGQISTATGRMSCSKPNAQQYPKAITGIVIPREQYIMLDADYSQIEYRVLTALAGNEGLAKLFADPDSDYHTLMASMMYGVPYASVTPKMRSDAKSFNFGIPYGMGFKSLAILLTGNSKPSSVEEAKEKYELYFQNQPKTRKFFDQIKEMAQVNKYTKTFWSRYRYYSFTDADGNENNARKAAALRQAGNAVIQGTAADVFKISVARNFMYIRENHLLGLLIIVNMIHDEQLMEVNAQYLNIQRVLADVGKNMQFKVEGFPPLYIGAGIGPAWGKAKGKMAEIHPLLLQQFTDEANNIPLWKETPEIEANCKAVYDYFASRVLEFRRQKVENYLKDPANYGQDLHPAIGNLLNLQFTYGHDKDKEGLKDDEFTMLCLKEFIEHNNLTDVKPEYFTAKQESMEDAEEDDEYTDGDEDDVDELETIDDNTFQLIDESDVAYGSSIQDLLNTFNFFISDNMKICGINSLKLSGAKKDEVVEYLIQHMCEPDDPGALEIIFLQEGNILKRTGMYVNHISSEALEEAI